MLRESSKKKMMKYYESASAATWQWRDERTQKMMKYCERFFVCHGYTKAF